jgi:drug/metabolite transporter (DMT)-like permease
VLVLAALILVTAVWGLTFVQVKDAIAVYPLFAFLALRFAIASLTLAPVAVVRVPRLGRRGVAAAAALGLLLAVGYALQTAGLELTSVSNAGFVTGLYVVFTPLFAFALFRIRTGRAVVAGVLVSVVGLALLGGGGTGSVAGDALVLGGSAAYSLQIALMERYAPRYDALGFTFVEMLAAFGGFAVVAAAVDELRVPRGWVVWGALIVTGVFASAFAFLIQMWAQRRTTATRTALAFALEPVFAALFGYTLAGDRLGPLGWAGAALIMVGIAFAEPSAAGALRRLVAGGSSRS